MTLSGIVGTTFAGVTLSGNGKVFITGDSLSGIGVTLNNAGAVQISNTPGVTWSGTPGVTLGIVKIRPDEGGTTFGIVFTNKAGTALGLCGGNIVGIPVVGVGLGVTAIGVTFTGITLASVVGVTFPGVTFTTVRTVVVGSSFADGGNSLGIPVYGVAGATSVKVEVVGGTVAGIFVTDAPGITIMGVSSGIPVFGVSGATAIGVTFGSINSTITFPTTGITIASINSGVTVGVTGTVAISGSVSIGSMPASTTVNYTTSTPNDVPIKAGSDMGDKAKILAASTASGIVVTPKGGNQFMWGMTLGLFLGISAGIANIPSGSDLIGASGATVWFLKPTPLPVTMLYAGLGRDGFNNDGHTAVPLKQGLHIQLTKWDAISHVLIGYTASSQFEFLKNAQVLTKEYQVAPVWANAMEQFRRLPGGATFAAVNQSHLDVFGAAPGIGDAREPKTYMGVIEKPSRIFVPTNDAGLVYILPKADIQSHAIGSGFWDEETGVWTSYTLYERSHYASEVYGMSGAGFCGGLEPNLTDGGSGATFGGQYGQNPPGGAFPVITGATANFISSQAVSRILASHAQPFIRIWGY